MLKGFSTCRWLQVCLGLIFVQTILGDCVFPPLKLQNGRMVLQSPEDVNATTAKELYLLRFYCFAGYTLIGPKAIVCSEEKWSDYVPTCTKMQCSDPPVIENGKYQLHSGVIRKPTLGSTVVYSCNVGYELENNTIYKLTCNLRKNGNTAYWNGDVPKCRKKESCPDPGVSPDGQREGDCCFTEDVLHFSCNDGFQLVGEDELQCLSTGRWSSRRPLCRPLEESCDLPPPIMHGIVTGDKTGDYYMPWEEVEVLCEPGYTYRGPSKFIMCEEDGQWEDVFGNCTVTFCDFPEPLANGTILELESTNTTEFPYNFELTYVCDKGYRLEGGDSWRLCLSDGWSGKTPYCTAIHCPDPGAPENGAKEGNSYAVGAKVRFKCSTGYFLIGSIERHCMPNGQWTGELARCDTDINYCPNPGIPINGFKNNSNYDMGEIVGFGCRQGYFQVGSDVRECLPNKTWSGKETTCLGPYDFDNGAQIRDQLQSTMNKKAEEQQLELQRYREAQNESLNCVIPVGRIIDISYPGRRLILYFIFDVSGSVGRINFEKSVNFSKAIVKKVGISNSGARAGALTFSSKAVIQFLPLEYTTTDEVLDALDSLNYTGGGTSTTSALTLVREECIPITQKVFGKQNQKSIVFVLTDGRANMGGDPQGEAETLKKAGVEIYCIGITGKVQKDTLYKIASDSTEEQHVFILESYATLSWLIQELTNGTVDYSQCGLGLEKAGNRIPRARIVGGSQAPEPWPWMVAIYFLPLGSVDSSEAELKCGGSIINEYFILTAAHCMYTTAKFNIRDPKEVIVKLGLTHVKNETFVQEPEVKSFFVHPKYQPGSFYDYDIAILQLSKPIEYNAYVRPICLPPIDVPQHSILYKPQEYALATGWGHEGIVFKDMDVDMKMSERLKELILPIQSRAACNQSLIENRIKTQHFTDRMFCAGEQSGGNDTCRGDSGGPLMQSQLNEEGYLYWTQVGIVSWGIGCGLANTFGFYSHVSQLRLWIDDQIRDALESEF